jgi:hypothetical protein
MPWLHKLSCRSRKSADKEWRYRDSPMQTGSATMRPATAQSHRGLALARSPFALARSIALVMIAGGLLAGCETDGSTPGPFAALSAPAKPAEPAKPPEPPMTRSRAATECWMSTEKGSASGNLDKRADIVTKCIDDKMKAVSAAPQT